MKKLTIMALMAFAGCTEQQDVRSEKSSQATRPADNAMVAREAPVVPDGAANDPSPYVGRWTGVEGMYLLVSRGSPGVKLEMQWDLDHKGTFEGIVTTDGVEFERNGETLRLVHAEGAATQLSGLTAKKDCLVVKAGEGYCRD